MERNEYDIPASAVAEAIIRRLTLARRARAAMALDETNAPPHRRRTRGAATEQGRPRRRLDA